MSGRKNGLRRVDVSSRVDPGADSTVEEAQSGISALLRETSEEAARITAKLPAVDIQSILHGATGPEGRAGAGRTVVAIGDRSRLRAWVPRVAAAAATLAVVAGALLVLRPAPLPDGEIPEHLVALVDSLYPESNYIQDQLADIMWPRRDANDDAYLDEVWDTVISDIDRL